jgi:hypothetical protein
VGRAKGRHEVLQPGDPHRIRNDDGYHVEWRVPIDEWAAWAAREEDAYPWQMPHASFLDVRGDNCRELRKGVRRRFLGDW